MKKVIKVIEQEEIYREIEFTPSNFNMGIYFENISINTDGKALLTVIVGSNVNKKAQLGVIKELNHEIVEFEETANNFMIQKAISLKSITKKRVVMQVSGYYFKYVST